MHVAGKGKSLKNALEQLVHRVVAHLLVKLGKAQRVQPLIQAVGARQYNAHHRRVRVAAQRWLDRVLLLDSAGSRNTDTTGSDWYASPLWSSMLVLLSKPARSTRFSTLSRIPALAPGLDQEL